MEALLSDLTGMLAANTEGEGPVAALRDLQLGIS